MTEAVSDSRARAALDRVLAEPETHIHPAMGAPGHTLPRGDRLIAYDLDDPEQAEAAREAHGIRLQQVPDGSGNVLAVDQDLKAPDALVEFNGRDSLVVLGRNARLVGELRLMHQSIIVISGQSGGRVLRLKVNLRDSRERLFWGSGSSSEGTATSVKGHDVAWIVGDDCMFSWGVWVRPSDMHMIIDPAQRRVINQPRDVIVGPHVWVGQNALIMKGATIGAGSIIGANGLVPAGTLDAMSIYAGQPVTKLREGVTWDREHDPSEAAFDRAEKVARMYVPTWQAGSPAGGPTGSPAPKPGTRSTRKKLRAKAAQAVRQRRTQP